MSQVNNVIAMLCSVCLEQYTSEMPPIEIKNCKHYFHEKCLTSWTDECGTKGTDPSCPDCRQKYKKEDVKVNNETLNIIIKNNLKIKVNFIMISGEKMELVLVQSNTVQQIFDMLVIYNKPYEQQDLSITVNQKQYTLNDKKKLIYDLKFSTDEEVQVSPIESYFQVFVNQMHGGTITVKVKATMPASDFSKIVSASTGIPEGSIRFQYQSKNFDSKTKTTIGELGIQRNATIHQLGRLLGGQLKKK